MYWKFNSSSLYTIKLFQVKILRCSYRTKKQLVYYNVLVVAKRQTMSRRRDNLWIIIWLPHSGYCCSSYKLILNIWNVHRCWRWVSYTKISRPRNSPQRCYSKFKVILYYYNIYSRAQWRNYYKGDMNITSCDIYPIL